MDNSIWLTVAIAAVIVIAILAGFKASGAIRVVARPLLTAREREALNKLEKAFPQFRVFPQVAMGALIQAQKGLNKSQRAQTRNSFDRKIVDFVLEDRASGRIFAIIELDDRTHDAAKDSRRDVITQAAGYRTIRLPAGRSIDLSGITAALSDGGG